MAEKKIADLGTIKVDPMVASEAIALYADIMRVVGSGTGRLPAIIIGLESQDEGNNLMADVAALAAVTDMLKATGTDQVQALIRRIVESAMILQPSGSYRQIDLDGDFTGKLKTLIPVIRFVVQEQFSDFFIGSAGGGILGMLQEALAKRKPGK